MKVILHIGLPKTATTTIQHTLWNAREVLAKGGVSYPSHFASHHDLARHLERGASGRRRGLARVDNMLAAFAEDARRCEARKMLISSEALFSLMPEAVPLLAERLQACLPRTEVLVVAYVRDPIGFATSMGQQAIKAGRLRLSELYENPYPVSVSDTLYRFSQAFGRENLVVRPFDEAQMKNGNVIADFLEATGIGELPLPQETPMLNTTLTSEGVQVADALNAFRPRSGRNPTLRGGYKRALEVIGWSKFVLPAEVQDRVIAQSREDMDRLRELFGLDIAARRVTSPPRAALPEATATAMARMVERLVERGAPPPPAD